MDYRGTIKAAFAVVVVTLVIVSIVAPIINDASKDVTIVENEGAGWTRYAYYDEAADYNVSLSSDGSTLTMGDQSGTASDMIVYATDDFSIVHADGAFQLIASGGSSAALGASASVVSSSGTITVKDSSDADAYATSSATWAYVPDGAGTFGFFDTVGADLGGYPLAAASSPFAGLWAYNDINNLDIGVSMSSTVTDGALTAYGWAPDPVTTTGYTFQKATDTTVYTDGDFKFRINPNGNAEITAYTGAGGDIVFPATVTTDGTTYDVETVGHDGTPVFDSSVSCTVAFSEGIKAIAYKAFYECTGITNDNLTFPDSILYLGAIAFGKCSGITGDLILPPNLEYLGSFSGCIGLDGVIVIPAGITALGIAGMFGPTVYYSPHPTYDSVIILGDVTYDETYGTVFNTHTTTGTITEFFNLGGGESLPALPADAVVKSAIENMGYIAPAYIYEETQREGLVYDIMVLLPVLMIVGVLVAAASMLAYNRRA